MTIEPRRFLLAAHPTVGHTSGLRAIGRRLLRQGHAVAFALAAPRLPFGDLLPEPIRTSARLPGQLAADGFELKRLSLAPAAAWIALRLPHATGLDELELALRLFTRGLVAQARQVAAHARATRAEVVVFDYLLPAAMLGAEAAGVPAVAFYHSALPFPAAGAPAFGSALGDRDDARAQAAATARLLAMDQQATRDIAQARETLGLSPRAFRPLAAPVSADLNLLATTPALEPGLLPIEGPVVMTGPCLPEPGAFDPKHPALRALSGPSPRAYVSLGTVFNGQPRVFDAILDGLEHEVLVSAGASAQQVAARAGPRVHVFDFVPQVPLLEQVDVVVTHGGNNTVQECLAAGRPMVVVPFGGDQLENARRVERLGVGVALPPAQLAKERVRAAVAQALAPAVVERARALGAAVRGVDGTGAAVAALERFLGERRTLPAQGPVATVRPS